MSQNEQNHNDTPPPPSNAEERAKRILESEEQNEIERNALQSARRAKLNEGVRGISPGEFVASMLPPLPDGHSSEYVPEPLPFILDDGNPVRPHLIANGGADASGAASADSDNPRDSKGNIFRPDKYLLNDEGEPQKTGGGRFRPIPAKRKDREELIQRQIRVWNERRSAAASSGSGEESEGEAHETGGACLEDCEKEASLWVQFVEDLLSLILGERGKMQPLDNGSHEKELIKRGVASGFSRFRILKFPAFLALGIGFYAYGRRVFNWKGSASWFSRKPKGGESESTEIIEVEAEEPSPRPADQSRAREIYNQL